MVQVLMVERYECEHDTRPADDVGRNRNKGIYKEYREATFWCNNTFG
jgi:hypothetical protein